MPRVSGVRPSVRFLIHDRDSIFSPSVDESLKGFGMRVLKTPVRAPKAIAFCERLIGTVRRECVDYFIPLNERHLKVLVDEFAVHYNRGRPHSSLGPGMPEPNQTRVPASCHDPVAEGGTVVSGFLLS